MKAYIEIPVGIKPYARWVSMLEGKLRPWHPCRFDRHYHLTAVFFNDIDTKHLYEVAEKVGDALRDMQPVSVTFGNIDIFRDCSGHYIVYLDTKDNAIDKLIWQLRHVAERSGADYRRDFKRHITLAKIDIDKIDEGKLREIIGSAPLPTFCIDITTVKLINRKNSKENVKWCLHVTNQEV